jgi:hypothetical protein
MDRDSLYYTEVSRQTKEQEETRRHFDSMATNTLGFSAVILSLILLRQTQFCNTQLSWLIASLLAFLGVAISTIYILWLRKWELSPPLKDLYKNMVSLEYEDEALVLWSSNAMADAIDNNKKYLRRKAYGLRFAYVFLSLEVLFLGLMIITSIYT